MTTIDLNFSAVRPLNAHRAKQCPVRLQNDLLSPPGVISSAPSEATQSRMEGGREFEESVLDELEALHPGSVRVGHRPDARQATLTAMQAGAPLILAATLPDDLVGRRVGQPDLLIRVDGGYLPADVKHHGLADEAFGRTVRISALAAPAYDDGSDVSDTRWKSSHEHNDALQLAHYWRMLESIGFAPPSSPRGAVLDRSRQFCWIDLSDHRHSVWWLDHKASWMERYDHEFEFRRDVAAHTELRINGADLAPKVVPAWVSECTTCPWSKVCRDQLEEIDHVSLLPRSTWQHFVEYRRRGVVARSGLASLDPLTARVIGDLTGPMLAKIEVSDPATPLDGLFKRPELIADLATTGIVTTGDLRSALDPATLEFRDAKVGNLLSSIDNARAAVAGSPYRRRGAPTLDLPTAVVEIDVDMEASATQRNYLWGALPVVDGLAREYEHFDSYAPMTDPEEAAVFIRFWTWLAEMRDKATGLGGVLRIYHWTDAELSAMRAILDRAASGDLPTRLQLETAIASEWVDLSKVYDKLVVTGGSISVKRVAKSIGFEWNADDAGGDLSMVHHAAAVAGDHASVEWLQTYNRDDVLATYEIRQWLRAKVDDLPRIEDWKGA